MSIFEITLLLKGFDIGKAEKKLKHIQSLSTVDFRKWQEEQKWAIAKYHFENNEFFKNKVKGSLPESWDEIPFMEKKDFQNDINKLLSIGYSKKNCYISSTSGSSGTPMFFAKDKNAHSMDWALIKNRYSWHDISLNSKQARFYGIPLKKWNFFNEKIKDFVMNRDRFSVYDLSDNVLKNYLKKFKKIKYEYIYGYTNSLVLFARYLKKNKIILSKICPSLKCCITTSEILTSEDREILIHGFGVDVINEYGTSECGQLAMEDYRGKWLLSDETTYFEIIENSHNGHGKIVVTDLDNKAMPFIRYNIGDIGKISKYNSKNGLNRELISLYGRENDIIYLPSGKISPGFTLYYVSRAILESSGILKEYRIRQTKINKFIFEVVTDEPLKQAVINDIKNELELYLEPGLDIIFKRVEKIKQPLSGKFKHFISEL